MGELSTMVLPMKLRSIDEMPELKGKRVLVRVDHNVEFDQDGKLKDDRKLKLSIPTLEALASRGAELVLMTHVGRPKGKVVENLRTAPIAEHLRTLSKKLGNFTYLENVRFDTGEEGNDPSTIKELASHGEFFVNEAFPSLHMYEEASTCGVARLLPSYAGYHLIEETNMLSALIEDPRRPVLLLMSGAKMETKIPVIRRFLEVADTILLGGAIANTFIAARGFDVGTSKYEEDAMDLAQELMLEADKVEKADIHIPRDAVLASEVSEEATKIDLPLEDIVGDMMILDIGTVTVKRYCDEIAKAGTIIWNGPMGLYEYNRFSHGTKRIAEAIAEATKKGAYSVIGGGDTLDFHARYDCPIDCYSFVSSGGGAMIEFLSAEKPLPALVPMLMEKEVTA